MTRHLGWLGFVLAVAARSALGQAPADHNRFEARWPLDSDGSVRIVDPAGRIRVIGWDVDSLVVSGRGPGRLAAAGTVGVRKLVVTGRAALEGHVPRGARVWVKSASADIDVVGVDGTLDLNSVAGGVHVGGPPADVTGGAVGGPGELAGGGGGGRGQTGGGG